MSDNTCPMPLDGPDEFFAGILAAKRKGIAALRLWSDNTLQALRDEREELERLRELLRLSNASHDRGLGELGSRVIAAEARAAELEAALRRIAAIENQQEGGDWDEIEEVRGIAKAVLSGTTPQADQIAALQARVLELQAELARLRPVVEAATGEEE